MSDEIDIDDEIEIKVDEASIAILDDDGIEDFVSDHEALPASMKDYTPDDEPDLAFDSGVIID